MAGMLAMKIYAWLEPEYHGAVSRLDSLHKVAREKKMTGKGQSFRVCDNQVMGFGVVFIHDQIMCHACVPWKRTQHTHVRVKIVENSDL